MKVPSWVRLFRNLYAMAAIGGGLLLVGAPFATLTNLVPNNGNLPAFMAEMAAWTLIGTLTWRGLATMRKWGVILACLVPTAQLAIIYLSEGTPDQVSSMNAFLALGTTLFTAASLVPYWGRMIWNPLPFNDFGERPQDA